MKAWDANVGRDDPERFWSLPDEQQTELRLWVEAHTGPQNDGNWIGRVEYDLIDAPLLRVWFINDDGDLAVDEPIYRDPVELPVRYVPPAFVGAP